MFRNVERLILVVVVLAVLVYVGFQVHRLQGLGAKLAPLNERIAAIQKRLAENAPEPISPDPTKCFAKVKADWRDCAATASFSAWAFYEGPAAAR